VRERIGWTRAPRTSLASRLSLLLLGAEEGGEHLLLVGTMGVEEETKRVKWWGAKGRREGFCLLGILRGKE